MDKIEKLRAEIERLHEEHTTREYRDEAALVLEDLVDYIDSLQQEQQEEPDKGLDVTDFCKPIDPGIAQCVADHWWELLGDKEPNKSLEEVAVEYSKSVSDGHNYRDLTCGFIAGASWQKQQMLKDAVEADVNTYEDLVAGKSWAEFVVRMPTSNLGDKVRIIVLKAEEE